MWISQLPHDGPTEKWMLDADDGSERFSIISGQHRSAKLKRRVAERLMDWALEDDRVLETTAALNKAAQLLEEAVLLDKRQGVLPGLGVK